MSADELAADHDRAAAAGQLPEPPGPPLPVWLQTVVFARYRHLLLPALQRRYGDVYTVRIAPHRRRVVMLANPDHVKQVFTGPAAVFHAGEGNAILRPIMGQDSVLLLDEREHLRVRQLLMPAFHGAALRGYRELITDLTRQQVRDWPVGDQFAVHRRTQRLTLEIILQVVFGVTDEARLARLRPVVSAVLEIRPLMMLGWFYPRLRPFWPWSRFTAIQQQLDRLLYAEIADRRTVADLTGRDDVLSRLLRVSADQQTKPGAVRALTDAELRDNLVTLLLAGHETTATALAWTFHELARNPGVQRRAQAAADAAGDEAAATGEAYLLATFKESLRLHPIIYEVARRLTAPVEVGGFRIRRGATVMPAIGLVQSDGRWFSDPAAFDPLRFVDGQPASNTWIPFGGGVRRCLGAGFAELEATAVLAEVLRAFDVEPDRARPEAPAARNITLAPSRGGRIRLVPRQRPAESRAPGSAGREAGTPAGG